MYDKKFTTNLQKDASVFLQGYYLLVNNIAIYLKEIEVYYYEHGRFEDYSVHRNILQKKNKHKFYIHRYGQDADSSYKSSPKNNRGGCDFVMSDSDGVYYSYLIRSIVINDELYVGPRKTLNAIIENTGLSYEELEKANVTIVPFENNHDVLNTSRIGLGNSKENDAELYKNAELRCILCDKYFVKRDNKNVGYARRTEAIYNFLKRKLETGEMTKEEAIKYSNDWYGAVSRWLKDW